MQNYPKSYRIPLKPSRFSLCYTTTTQPRSSEQLVNHINHTLPFTTPSSNHKPSNAQSPPILTSLLLIRISKNHIFLLSIMR